MVLPCYNGQRWLRIAIESVLAQSYGNLELVIVNDGSTDNSVAMINPYLDDKRVVYVSQENRGFSAAINRGIRECSSDYIGFIGQDDCWLPEKLQNQMCHRGSADIVFSGCYVMDGAGRITDRAMPRLPRFLSTREALRRMFLNNFILLESVIVRRETLLAADLFDEKMAAFSDQDMWFRVIGKARLRYLRIPLVKKRQHEHQLSRRVDLILRDQLYFVKKALQEYPFLIDDVPTALSQIYYQCGRQVGLQGDKQRANYLLSLSLRYDPSNTKAILARDLPTAFNIITKLYQTYQSRKMAVASARVQR